MNYPDLNNNNIPDIFDNYNTNDYNYFVPGVDNSGIEVLTDPNTDLELLEDTATMELAQKIDYNNYLLYKNNLYLSISVSISCIMFGIVILERIFKK